MGNNMYNVHIIISIYIPMTYDMEMKHGEMKILALVVVSPVVCGSVR